MTPETAEFRLSKMEQQLEHLTSLMERSVSWQSRFGEFVDEMSPVARTMMDTGVVELANLEERGYFRFGQDLLETLDRVVESYEPGSLPALADSFADLIYILRLVSQPRVLAAVQDLAEEVDIAGGEPIEVLGAAKRIETERDIQRGIAFALDLFGTLGRSISRAPRLRTGSKDVKAVPPRERSRPVVERPQQTRDAEPAAHEFNFVSDAEWGRQWAEKMSQALGLGDLCDDRWNVIQFSRQEYKETKKAPNIRRITKGLDISTKDIYALFPVAPGPTISKLAGVPKPAGCL